MLVKSKPEFLICQQSRDLPKVYLASTTRNANPCNILSGGSNLVVSLAGNPQRAEIYLSPNINRHGTSIVNILHPI